jgi:hypothetical protein
VIWVHEPTLELFRGRQVCLSCGRKGNTVPHHALIKRRMGGGHRLDVVPNLAPLCPYCNGVVEDSPELDLTVKNLVADREGTTVEVILHWLWGILLMPKGSELPPLTWRSKTVIEPTKGTARLDDDILTITAVLGSGLKVTKYRVTLLDAHPEICKPPTLELVKLGPRGSKPAEVYHLAHMPTGWECSCPDFIHRRENEPLERACKHLLSAKAVGLLKIAEPSGPIPF